MIAIDPGSPADDLAGESTDDLAGESADDLAGESADDLVEVIRNAGLKVTAPRVEVLRSLAEHSHVTADQVFDRVRLVLPGTSIQAVYGVLGALTEARVTRRIEPAGSAARYERRVGDNHHHSVCTECGAIADIDCVLGPAPCLAPAATAGFAVNTAEITFWGICAKCQPVASERADPDPGLHPDPATTT